MCLYIVCSLFDVVYIVHYASQNIKEIIEDIKNNPYLDWNNTIAIITSDNGAAPTAANGYASGSALPLRKKKFRIF